MPHTSLSEKIEHATDHFIHTILPSWLKRASAQEVCALRDAYGEHMQSQTQIATLFARISPLQAFARLKLEQALTSQLAVTVDLDKACWQEVRRHFTLNPGSLPTDEPRFVSEPALQRFMQNFASAESFYEGTRLSYPADETTGAAEQVLSSDHARIVEVCRQVDVGKAYQAHLDAVFDAQATQALAQDACHAFTLATRLAMAKRLLAQDEANLLLELAARRSPRHPSAELIRCGELTLLGATLSGVWVVELRALRVGGFPVHKLPDTVGVLLLAPNDEHHPVRHFAGWSAVNDHLLQTMGVAESAAAILQRVALHDRAAFMNTLQLRIKDSEPDLEPGLATSSGELFTWLAAQRIRRIRNDALFLAVPSTQADSRQRALRQETLASAGLVLLNLAGLFVPSVGALLVADMARRTLSQVCVGVQHWARGNQHEALLHLLGVAETLAVNAAIAGGAALVRRSFSRSAFVEQLEPVRDDAGQSKLWCNDLSHYAVTLPATATIELDNGLFSDGDSFWWCPAGECYPVRAQGADGPWRLTYPDQSSGFGPALEFNGERAWRLAYERPLQWQGREFLLGRLWPRSLALSGEQRIQVLRVANIDEPQLRGLLVENRRMPVALRDSLERFHVQDRINTFFADVAKPGADVQMWQFCVDQLGLGSLSPQAQADAIADQARSLRPLLFEHFACLYVMPDPALALLQRDFPGLPDAYALDVLRRISVEDRVAMRSQQRIPLGVAQQARELLQMAQLTRMREGLFLQDSYRPEVVGLVFALLHERAFWPASLGLELREESVTGRVLARLQGGETPEHVIVMVRAEGVIRLYDSAGTESPLAVAEPRGLVQVLHACMPAQTRSYLMLNEADGVQALQALLRQWLPSTREALLQLLGRRDVGAPAQPLRRLPDGRVGYLLSGRQTSTSASRDVLRRRIGALYSGFDDTQVDNYMQMLLQLPGDAYSILLAQEQQYSRLKDILSLWVERARSALTAQARRRAARRLRRCWQLIGEQIRDQHETSFGLRLNLSNLPLRSLPDLPGDIDFGHVGELVLTGLGIEAIPETFLACFGELRWLNLSNNALRHIPAQIDRLRHLRALQLSNNQIGLNIAGVSMLRNLTQLRTLDLSGNPLGTVSLQLRPLVRLRELNLRGSNLQAPPVDLAWCGLLEVADLRNNHIATLSQGLLEAPAQLRQALQMNGNPLPVATLERLRTGLEPAAARPVARLVAPENVRERWLQVLPEPARQASGRQWDALLAEPGSDDFFRLLAELTETSDYRLIRADLGRRVWAMLQAASENGELRHELFSLAGDARTCVDSVASCFSALEVRLYIAQTLGIDEPIFARAARLRLARRLFRLERVEAIARDEVQRRQQSGEQVDEVEVSLAYRSGLAETLDLPGQPRTMQFPSIADVTLLQLNHAAATVRSAEASDELARYISQRDFWLENLRHEHGPAFSEIEAPFWARLDQLSQQSQGPEGRYLEQVNTLARERKAAIDALALRLTGEALRAVSEV